MISTEAVSSKRFSATYAPEIVEPLNKQTSQIN